jgi:hypothetical protein
VETVRVRFEKWGRRPHWEYDAVRLGTDDHGTWLGLPTGTPVARPGAHFLTEQRQVVLVPRAAAFVATFYEPAADPPCAVYVDISTPPVDTGDTISAVDLDLDVIRGRTGRVWVDDEDEFAAHQTLYGYSDHVVDLALRSCAEVRDAVEARVAPYDDGTAHGWINRLDPTMMQA